MVWNCLANDKWIGKDMDIMIMHWGDPTLTRRRARTHMGLPLNPSSARLGFRTLDSSA